MADLAAPTVTGPGSTFLQSLQLPSSIANTQANTAVQQAQIPLLGAQAQELNLQNQWTQQQLAGLPGLLGGGSGSGAGGAPSDSGAPSPVGSAGITDADIQGAARNGFAPLPTQPTPEVMNRALGATILYKSPAAGDLVKQQYVADTQAKNVTRAQAADNAYVSAQSVANAPPGTAFDTLARLQPQLAAQLKQAHGDDTPAQLDADVRLYASHWGLQVHQYGTRGSHMDNGTLVDNVDNKPVLGSQQLLTGGSAEDKQKTFASANEIITDAQGNRTPRYTVEGFSSAEAYVMAADKAARTSAAAPAAGGAAPAAPTNGAPGGPIVSAASTPPASAPRPAAPAPAPAPRPAAPAAAAPAASADPWATIPKGVPPSMDTPNAINKYKTETQPAADKANHDVIDPAAATAVQEQQRNDDAVSNLGSISTGPLSSTLVDAKRVLVQMGLATPDQVKDVAAYQAYQKNAINTALLNGRSMFGSRFTQAEVNLMKTQANPSADMTKPAIHELTLQDQIRQGYAIQRQTDYNTYISKGGRPDAFNGWYNSQQQFTLRSYAVAHRDAENLALQVKEGLVNAPPEAVAQLRAHPEMAPDFIKYYGGTTANPWLPTPNAPARPPTLTSVGRRIAAPPASPAQPSGPDDYLPGP